MGRDGSMYLIVDRLKEVENLENAMPKELRILEEEAPVPEQPRLRVINSIWTRRVLLDNVIKVLYK